VNSVFVRLGQGRGKKFAGFDAAMGPRKFCEKSSTRTAPPACVYSGGMAMAKSTSIPLLVMIAGSALIWAAVMAIYGF
jgi:hypothetical protein